VGSGCWSLAVGVVVVVVVVAGVGAGCCCVWLFLKERNLEKKETIDAVLALPAMLGMAMMDVGCRMAVCLSGRVEISLVCSM
jgi:hypothetical protein